MLAVSRAQARLLRAVLRHSILDQDPYNDWPVLLCRAGPRGLEIQSYKGDLAVSFHLPGEHPEGAVTVPISALAEFAGRTDDPVQLEQVAAKQGKATWTEDGVPRVLNFDTVEPASLPAFPKAPRQLVPMPPNFLSALDEAVRTTAKDATRYALVRILLHGKGGQVIATDGRQLLSQGGFPFPWTDDVLVPRVPAFTKKNLLPAEPVRMGRTDSHIVLELGPWALYLRIDRESRYPNVQSVVPAAKCLTTRLQIDPDDAVFVQKTLLKLPGIEAEFSPVTLDLEGTPRIRAKEIYADSITELALSRSMTRGKPMQVCLNRHYLRRAVQMGFRELHFASADKPVLCRNGQSLYLWVPLQPESVIKPRAGMLRVASTDQTAPRPSLSKQRRKTAMPSPAENGRPESGGKRKNAAEQPDEVAALIDEAEELRRVVQEANGRLSQLLANLKLYRRQSRAFRSAVASLRQLKLDG